jgi:hypothetical protein
MEPVTVKYFSLLGGVSAAHLDTFGDSGVDAYSGRELYLKFDQRTGYYEEVRY